MKPLIALILAITATALQAQNLTVSVKFDNNDPVGYAYISINNKIIAATDSIGVALIPIDKINLLDTIAASFVGYGKESVLITDEVKRKMACDIILTRTYDVDEIVVVGTVDADALYKKYTDIYPFYHWGTIYDLAYKYVLKKNNSSVKSGEGSLSLVYIWKKDREKGRSVAGAYAYPEANVQDETSFEKQLIASVHHNISSASRFYHSMFIHTNTLRYLGIQDNCRVFTSVSIKDHSKTQIVCFFDKETKLLSHFELSMIEYDDDGHIVMTRESEFDVSRDRSNIIVNEYYITHLKEVTTYKDIVLTTEIGVERRALKSSKNIPVSIVPDIKLLLDSDYSDKKYNTDISYRHNHLINAD